MKEWPQIQKFFESPSQLINLVTKFEEFVERALIEEKNIKYSMDMLLEFAKNNIRENPEFNIDIIKVLAEFINSACKYFLNFKINVLKISPIKPPDELNKENECNSFNQHKKDHTSLMKNDKFLDKSNNKIIEKTFLDNDCDKSKLKKNSEVKVKNRTTCRSSSKIDQEKQLVKTKKEIDIYLAKKKGLSKKNKLERIMNLKVKKPSVNSVLKAYLNKSSDFHEISFSSRKKKNEMSFNDGNMSFQEEIKKAQREIKEIEASKNKIMLLYEKQVKFCLKKCN